MQFEKSHQPVRAAHAAGGAFRHRILHGSVGRLLGNGTSTGKRLTFEAWFNVGNTGRVGALSLPA